MIMKKTNDKTIGWILKETRTIMGTVAKGVREAREAKEGSEAKGGLAVKEVSEVRVELAVGQEELAVGREELEAVREELEAVQAEEEKEEEEGERKELVRDQYT